MTCTLDFWFDYTCPYAYLGSTQAPSLAARMGVALRYRPLLLGGVFRERGTPQKLFATLSPAKAAHNAADLQRWARRFGVALTMPAEHPRRSVEALRATLAVDTDPRVVDDFYRAYWVDNADIADRGVIGAIVARHGHDADRVLAAIDTPALKNELRARTDEALALGIFGVPAWVIDGQLYWGQDRMRFVEAHGDGPALDVYWDFSSPFAYLASTQIDALARRTSARVTWRPMLLGGLFRAVGQVDVPMAAFSDAKQRYVMRDMVQWAAHWGVPFRFPSRFPTSSVRALRTYLALPEGRRAPFREAVFRAYWAEDRDITDEAVLAACVGDEPAAREALARGQSDEVKAALRSATEHAAAEGVFGAPTFVVGSGERRELFWGQDRLDLVEEALHAEAAARARR